MAVAPHGLPTGPGSLWAEPSAGARARAVVIGAGVALAVHLAVGVGLGRLDLSALFRGDRTVEIEVNEPPLPPPEARPEPPPPPPEPAAPRPKITMRAPRIPAPPPEAPPPPNQEAKPTTDTPPVFGVTMDSVVAGDGPGMAVPVGNTLMTKDRTRAKPAQAVQPLAGDAERLPAPVPEVFISERPQVLAEIKAEYPPDALRMGIEGKVLTRLLLDETGKVRQVRVIKPAGHGFDERAVEALKKYKFSPARTSDGKAVPTTIPFLYTFEHTE
jgi:periplasmic protein TonB